VYFTVATLVLMVAVLAVIALWTSSQPRSGAVPIGSATPSITLPATTGAFTLARLRGSKVVLYFYEGAG
jgi:hypothetical protein